MQVEYLLSLDVAINTEHTLNDTWLATVMRKVAAPGMGLVQMMHVCRAITIYLTNASECETLIDLLQYVVVVMMT